MLIRSTPQACFVILKNGLTLELFYDEALTGIRNGATPNPAGNSPQRASEHSAPSQGVWLMGEEVLFEVRAGQA
jgi:hypothetical protein